MLCLSQQLVAPAVCIQSPNNNRPGSSMFKGVMTINAQISRKVLTDGFRHTLDLFHLLQLAFGSSDSIKILVSTSKEHTQK